MKLKFCYVSGGMHPSIGQVLHPVQVISGSGEVVRYQRYLANAIGSVARDVPGCDRLLQLISSVESGQEDRVMYDADDVELTITSDAVQVDINANDEWVGNPEGRIGLTQWRSALDGWKRFLNLPQSIESVVEIEVPSS